LEFLDSPAALLARNHTVLSSNGHLRRAFENKDLELRGLRIGEVLDCKYATSHGLCGETFACFSCGLNRLLELSCLTGERLTEIPTRFQRQSGANPIFIISTERAGEAILLTIGLK
jgi:hypothetical protein